MFGFKVQKLVLFSLLVLYEVYSLENSTSLESGKEFCYVQQNNFVNIKISKDLKKTTLKLGLCGGNGWSSLIFSKTTLIENQTLGLIFLSQNQISKPKMFQVINHNFDNTKEFNSTNFKYFPFEKVYFYWNMVSMMIEIDQIWEWNYLLISCFGDTKKKFFQFNK